jgi:adenylate kinase
MKLILLGAPGTGKGTQAELITKKLSIPSISTGAIIREELSRGTELALQVKSYMEKGELVPDETVIAIIKGRLAQGDCKNGFILDGFPRTVPQAKALEAMGVTIDAVVNIELPEEVILARMAGRRVCPKCSATYNINAKKPIKDDLCDNCSTPLIIRDDDKPETMKNRLKVYRDQTAPLIGFYKEKGKLLSFDGGEEILALSEKILKAIEGAKHD